MINAILKGIFTLVIKLVSLLLLPIDTAINAALPGVASALNYVSNFFTYILQFVPWILSWFNLPSIFITFVVGYWTFKLTVPLAIHTVKLALAWYDKIKP